MPLSSSIRALKNLDHCTNITDRNGRIGTKVWYYRLEYQSSFDLKRPLSDTNYIWYSSSGDNGEVKYYAEQRKLEKVARIIQHQQVTNFTGSSQNRIIDGYITNVKQYPFFTALWFGKDGNRIFAYWCKIGVSKRQWASMWRQGKLKILQWINLSCWSALLWVFEKAFLLMNLS